MPTSKVSRQWGCFSLTGKHKSKETVFGSRLVEPVSLPRGESFDGEGADFDQRSITEVSVKTLVLDDSPRVSGQSEEHLAILAGLEEELPPIVVQYPSMRVVDGMHRVRLAVIKGRTTIKARLFDGSDQDAFVLAVRLNSAHGLALTRADRNAAAERVIRSHPQWSNRMVAKVVGLSAGTVAAIRGRSTSQVVQPDTRIGLDGRARPVNTGAGQRRVTELLAKKPGASIRAIAQEAGVSPSTVHAARKRMTAAKEEGVSSSATSEVAVQPPAPTPIGTRVHDLRSISDAVAVLARDPSLRLTESGRRMIRLLHRHSFDQSEYGVLVGQIPEHCVFTAAKLARQFAVEWAALAENLERRQQWQE